MEDPLHNYEYLPMSGHAEFTKAAAVLLFGEDSPVLKQNRVATVQTISGTGANYLGAFFTHKYYRFNGNRKVYVSDPTWGKRCLFPEKFEHILIIKLMTWVPYVRHS